MTEPGEGGEAEGGTRGVEGRSRPKQSFGNTPWEPGKSRVEPETLAYLTEVSEHAATLEDAEERDLLLGNVLEELEGKELRVAADAVCSRLLEALLAPAAPRHLIAFMGAFTAEDDLYKLAGRCGGGGGGVAPAGPGAGAAAAAIGPRARTRLCSVGRRRRPLWRPRPHPTAPTPSPRSAFGSHVAEGFLARLGAAADAGLAEDDAAALDALLDALAGAIGDQLYDYLMDRHATHVARALLRVAAGRDVVPASKQGKAKAAEKGGGGGRGAGGGGKAPDALAEKLAGSHSGGPPPPARFPRLLSRLARMLPCYDPPSMAVLAKNPYSGPFLQGVLRAAAGDGCGLGGG
jgi:hypothetical protein